MVSFIHPKVQKRKKKKFFFACPPPFKSVSKRFCAAKLKLPSGYEILIVCVYLPMDYGTTDSCDDVLFALAELNGFIDSQSYNSLLLVGDFNVWILIARWTQFADLNLIDELNLLAVDLSFRPSVKYTFESDDGSCTSWLDHILSDAHLACCVSDVRRLDFGSNLSDHHPPSFHIMLDCPV